MTGRRGLSLLEVMVALAIFSTLVVSMISVWATHAQAVAKARYLLLGVFVAERTLEECISKGFVGVDQMATPAEGATVNLTTWRRGNPITVTYTYHVTVDTMPGPVMLKSIRVRVEWPDKPEPRTVEVESLIYGTR